MHSTVHLGRVQGPVADADQGLRAAGSVEEVVQNLERHVNRVLCKPDLVEDNHHQGVWVRAVGFKCLGALKSCCDASARRLWRTLKRDQLDCRQAAEESVGGSRASQVLLDQPRRQRLGRARHTDQKQRDAVHNSNHQCRHVLAQSVVASYAGWDHHVPHEQLLE